MIGHVRGSWLPPRRVLRLLGALGVIALLVFMAFDLHRRSAAAAQRMTLTAVGRYVFIPGVPTTLRVIAHDDALGSPIEGVEVSATLILVEPSEPKVEISVAAASTNASGAAQLAIAIPEGTPPGRYRMEIHGNEDRDDAEHSFEVYVRKASQGAMLAVDKPRYQPGQTIHMRGVVFDAERKPAPGTEVEFVVTDSRGTLVAREKRKTSAYGIAAADVELATRLNLGDYTLTLETPRGSPSRQVKVATYTLPKFKVEILVDPEGVVQGQPLTGGVRATYTFGQPVVGADVRLTGTRVAGSKVTSQGTTDERGELRFELAFPAYDVISELEAVVSGEGIGRQSASQRLAKLLGARSEEELSIQVVPESDLLVRGLDNAVYLLVTDGAHRPVKATLRGVAREPFTLTSSELGIAKLEVEPQAYASQLRITAQAEDGAGRWGQAQQTLDVATSDGAFRLRTDRAAYSVGDEMSLAVRSELPGTVHIDLVDAQRTLASTELEVIAGRGGATLSIPPEASGVVELRAFRQHGPWRSAAKALRLFVVPKDELDLSLTFARESYRPGEEVTLDVLVRARDGQPAQAAVSLAGIDDAVLRSFDAPPGAELEQVGVGAATLLRSDATDASPSLVPVVAHVGVTSTQREAQRVALAAADPFAVPDRVHEEDLLRSEHMPAAVRSGLSGEQRRGRAESYWESDRYKVFKLLGVVFSFLASVLLLLIVRHCWSIGERVAREAPPARAKRALGWLALASLVSAFSLSSLHAQAGFFRSLVPFAIWCALWAGSGAVMWHAAGHMSSAWSLHRLGWSACAMHLLTHAVALMAVGMFHSRHGPPLVMASAALMLTTGAILGAARVVLADMGRPTAGLAFVLQLAVGGLLTVAGGLGFDVVVRRHPDPMTANQRAEKEMEEMESEALAEDFADNKEGGTGTRAKGMGGSMGRPDSLGTGNRYGVRGPGDGGALAGRKRKPERIREHFPETLLWRPEVITDAHGKAQVSFTLADSITTWNMSATAVTKAGGLAGAATTVRGFQDFFADVEVPPHLTIGDEVQVPVVVFNYLDEAQDIELAFETSDGLTVAGAAKQRLRVPSRRSVSAMFTLRAEKHGAHDVTVLAQGLEVADAIRRPVTVHLSHHRVVRVLNGAAKGERELPFELVDAALEEGRDLKVKIYPGVFSQIAEGLHGVFKKPHGCFEQTSSTTYPSILALSFLRRTGSNAPATEKEALRYIGLGYQRLLSFELSGGGFSLFGRAPASVVLSAYGLMEFHDMTAARAVDPKMIERTQSWLLSNQGADGRWDLELGAIRQTAYVAWALLESGVKSDKLGKALDQVASQAGLEPDQPYLLAMRANALIAGGRQADAAKLLDRLLELRDAGTGGWSSTERTMLYSSGRAASEEATALAVLALLRAKRNTDAIDEALAWLTEQRTANGTWHSTSATVAVMRALLERTQPAKPEDRTVGIVVNGESAANLELKAGATAYAMAELGDRVRDGDNSVTLSAAASGNLQYQVISSYFVPWDQAPAATDSDIALSVVPDRTQLTAGEEISVDVAITWRGKRDIRMPMIEIGVPPAMEVVTAELEKLKSDGKISLWGRSPQHVVLYLPALSGTSELSLRFRSRYGARVKMPASRAYAYYDPDVSIEVPPIDLVVR